MLIGFEYTLILFMGQIIVKKEYSDTLSYHDNSLRDVFKLENINTIKVHTNLETFR